MFWTGAGGKEDIPYSPDGKLALEGHSSVTEFWASKEVILFFFLHSVLMRGSGGSRKQRQELGKSPRHDMASSPQEEFWAACQAGADDDTVFR